MGLMAVIVRILSFPPYLVLSPKLGQISSYLVAVGALGVVFIIPT